MNLELKLNDLAGPKLSEALLVRSSRTLQEIKNRNETRWQQGGGSKEFRNRKEEMRRRLQQIHEGRGRFWDVQDQVGWQRILLSIYLDDLGKEWLLPFDGIVAGELLGAPGSPMNATRRRQVTQFFFTHYDSIEAISYVSQRLREAYATYMDKGQTPPISIWSKHRTLIFDPSGPGKVAGQASKGEALDSLRGRFALPAEGRFAEMLRQVYLLESIKHCSFGKEPDTLEKIESAKEETAAGALRLGAAALQILVDRVEKEGHGRWPEGWQKWIARLGCDPRLGRATAEGAKWWGWATAAQLNLALQGVIGLSLKVFFDLLDGTVSAMQWQERRKFLDGLFDSGKILDARLLLNQTCMRRLQPKMRDPWNTARLNSTTEDTCVIALRCTEDVYLLEGTHSYGLRAFYRRFPIKGLWERTNNDFLDRELRISPDDCPIFVRHSGDWIWKFRNELRGKFHIEWSNLRL